MSEHTPGPWHVIDGAVVNARFVIVSEHIDDAIVASLGGDVQGEEANARLIAAAPELLALLREAVSQGMPYGPSWFGQISWTERVTAAIAKAEGR